MSDVLDGIVKSNLCLGCGACASAVPGGKITMSLSAEGFFRPERKADLLPTDQDIIGKVCAGLELSHDERARNFPYHPLWGSVGRLAVGFAVDPDIRFRGSSGGVLTAVCDWLVKSGRVDLILSTGADPADPIGNETAARLTAAEIVDAAGSRYGPSSPLAGLEEHLARGERFAFVGKPCDVAALRKMARQDRRIDELIPIKLSFFCAGVPSRIGTLALLAEMGVALDDLSSFQYRGDGWPGFARAVRHDGTEVTRDYNSSWGGVLNRHLQFRCKICADGTGEFADIACADAWYGNDGYPDFTERDGRSLIVARSLVGMEVLKDLELQNVLSCAPVDMTEIEPMQPYQANRKRNVLARSVALRLAGGIAPKYRGFALGKLAANDRIGSQLRNFVGMLRRALNEKYMKRTGS